MPVTPIWPEASAIDENGAITFHGRTAESLLDEFGSPLYLIDTDEVKHRAETFVHAAANAFDNTVTHVSFAGKAFLSKEICRIVTKAGMLIDTCSMGEMRIALAAGVPGRRLVLHGNNKSDEEIALAIEQGFAKIVIDEPNEPARIAEIARKLGKRAKVMLRVTSGIHAGGQPTSPRPVPTRVSPKTQPATAAQTVRTARPVTAMRHANCSTTSNTRMT